MVRAILAARVVLAMAVAVCVGLWGLHRYPVQSDDPFLTLIQLQRPLVYAVLTYGYTTLWFTTPFLATSLLTSVLAIVASRYGAARLQQYLREFPRYADVVITRLDLDVASGHAPSASAAQWALVSELQQAFPTATVTLRLHRLRWMHDPAAPTLLVYGVLVTQRCGPFTLRREFAAPGDELAP
jgi:hypothetical protein